MPTKSTLLERVSPYHLPSSLAHTLIQYLTSVCLLDCATHCSLSSVWMSLMFIYHQVGCGLRYSTSGLKGSGPYTNLCYCIQPHLSPDVHSRFTVSSPVRPLHTVITHVIKSIGTADPRVNFSHSSTIITWVIAVCNVRMRPNTLKWLWMFLTIKYFNFIHT